MAKNKDYIPFSLKMSIILFIIAATLGYGIVEKRFVDGFINSTELVIKKLPNFEAKYVGRNEVLDQDKLMGIKSKLYMVHFWGTWCAPCEVELPHYVNLSKKFNNEELQVLIVAVNDEEKKVRKFVKRLGKLPENIHLLIDNSDQMLSNFGTVKVPETYLFSHDKKHLYKYIGPQDWDSQGHYDRLRFYLESVK